MLSAGLAVALLTFATPAGAWPSPRLVRVPSYDIEEQVVAYGRSQLLLLQPVGSHDPGITRVNLDGSIDRSFGNRGTVEILCEDAVVTKGGRILVGTSSHPIGSRVRSDARVTRLLPDGRRDPSFGVRGNTDVDFGGRYDTGQRVSLAVDGKILLAGFRQTFAVTRGESAADPAVARLRPDGSLDPSFGKDGVKVVADGGEIEILDAAATPDGGVVVEVGSDIEAALWKLTDDGKVDLDFGRRGWLQLRGRRQKYGYHEELFVAPQLAVLPGGKLLLAASGSPNRGPHRWERVVAVRLRPDGRIDRSFGKNGWAETRKGRDTVSVEGLTLLPGGVLAVATTFIKPVNELHEFGAVAFDPDGHLERRFGEQGRCRFGFAAEGVGGATGVADLGRRAVVIGSGDSHLWLLACRLRKP